MSLRPREAARCVRAGPAAAAAARAGPRRPLQHTKPTDPRLAPPDRPAGRYTTTPDPRLAGSSPPPPPPPTRHRPQRRTRGCGGRAGGSSSSAAVHSALRPRRFASPCRLPPPPHPRRRAAATPTRARVTHPLTSPRRRPLAATTGPEPAQPLRPLSVRRTGTPQPTSTTRLPSHPPARCAAARRRAADVSVVAHTPARGHRVARARTAGL